MIEAGYSGGWSSQDPTTRSEYYGEKLNYFFEDHPTICKFERIKTLASYHMYNKKWIIIILSKFQFTKFLNIAQKRLRPFNSRLLQLNS